MLCILWLGSSVGNLQPDEAVQFFKAAQAAAGHKTQVRLCSRGAKPQISAASLECGCERSAGGCIFFLLVQRDAAPESGLSP